MLYLVNYVTWHHYMWKNKNIKEEPVLFGPHLAEYCPVFHNSMAVLIHKSEQGRLQSVGGRSMIYGFNHDRVFYTILYYYFFQITREKYSLENDVETSSKTVS